MHGKHTVVKPEPNKERLTVKCCLDDFLSSSDADGLEAPGSHRLVRCDET